MTPAPPLILVGYGGHGLVVAAAALAAGRRVRGYCDRAERAGSDPFALPYLGPEDAAFDRPRDEEYFVAVGDAATRRRLDDRLGRGCGARLAAAVVHPSSHVEPTARVAAGAVICAGAVVQPLADVGRCAIVNTGARVDHECVLGAYAQVGPGAVLSGRVSLEAGAFAGAGATILPGLNVGAGATLGAGAVLTRDLPDGETWVGNPARPISRRP